MLRRLLGLCAAVTALSATPASAEWRAYDTQHFVIYSDDGEKNVTRLAERLESIDGLMRMATGLGSAVDPVKVRIYEVASDNEVEKALGLTGTGIAGFYDSNILGPYAVTPRKTFFQTGSFTAELILHHEYAHHFMLQYFPAIYPSWYTEGFAELIGSSKFLKDGKIGYGMPAKHRGSAISFNWMPLTELLTKPPEKVGPYDVYGQGWALAHFFTFAPGRSAQLRQYLTGLQAGKSSAEAAQAAFGDLGDLNRDAHRYLRAGSFAYRPVAVEIARPVIKNSRALGAGEAALIPEVIAFRDDELSVYRKAGERERELKKRQDNLANIRQKARQYAADPFALHFLAEAEYAAGNYAEAEAAADRLLALQPDHVRALVRKSLAMNQRARALDAAARTRTAAEARRLALRANKADPDDPLPMLAYYQSFTLAGEKPTRQAVSGLIEVVRLLPRDTAIRQLLVDELAGQKRWAEAAAVLMPIANSPHRSPRRDAAQEQLARLQAQLTGPPAPAAAPAS